MLIRSASCPSLTGFIERLYISVSRASAYLPEIRSFVALYIYLLAIQK